MTKKAILLSSSVGMSDTTKTMTLRLRVLNTETKVINDFYINELNAENYVDFTALTLPLDDGSRISLGSIHRYGKFAVKCGDIELLFLRVITRSNKELCREFVRNQVRYYRDRYNKRRFGSAYLCTRRFIHLYCKGEEGDPDDIDELIDALPYPYLCRAEVYVKPVWITKRRRDDTTYPVCLNEAHCCYDYFSVLGAYVDYIIDGMPDAA